MNKFIFLFLVLLNLAFCKPYVDFDMRTLFGEPTNNGLRSFDIGALYKGVENLYYHAKFYPLNFDNENEKNVAFNDLKSFLNIFETIRKDKLNEKLNDKIYFDLVQARLFVMAHNFDMNGFAKKADESYKKLLLNDKNGEIRIEFAEFLGNSARINEAKIEFEKALYQGNNRAYYGLSLAYLAQNKKDEAIKQMQNYIAKFPNDENAKKMLEIIKNSEIKFN